MGKENLLIYKIHIHILGNGKMGYLKDMEHKLLEIICMKGSFVKGKKMGEANFRMVMVAIIRDSFVIILFKEMVNILQRIIFGKEIGKMDIQKDKANKLLQKKKSKIYKHCRIQKINRFHNMQDNLSKDKNQDLVILNGIKIINTKVSLRKVNFMEKEHLNLKEEYMQEYGQMEHK